LTCPEGMLYKKHTNQLEFNMSLFADIHNPTVSTASEVDTRHLMASLFLNAVVPEEDTVEDGDGEEVVIPAHAFSD
jgi:hypothetical protein